MSESNQKHFERCWSDLLNARCESKAGGYRRGELAQTGTGYTRSSNLRRETGKNELHGTLTVFRLGLLSVSVFPDPLNALTFQTRQRSNRGHSSQHRAEVRETEKKKSVAVTIRLLICSNATAKL